MSITITKQPNLYNLAVGHNIWTFAGATNSNYVATIQINGVTYSTVESPRNPANVSHINVSNIIKNKLGQENIETITNFSNSQNMILDYRINYGTFGATQAQYTALTPQRWVLQGYKPQTLIDWNFTPFLPFSVQYDTCGLDDRIRFNSLFRPLTNWKTENNIPTYNILEDELQTTTIFNTIRQADEIIQRDFINIAPSFVEWTFFDENNNILKKWIESINLTTGAGPWDTECTLGTQSTSERILHIPTGTKNLKLAGIYPTGITASLVDRYEVKVWTRDTCQSCPPTTTTSTTTLPVVYLQLESCDQENLVVGQFTGEYDIQEGDGFWVPEDDKCYVVINSVEPEEVPDKYQFTPADIISDVCENCPGDIIPQIYYAPLVASFLDGSLDKEFNTNKPWPGFFIRRLGEVSDGFVYVGDVNTSLSRRGIFKLFYNGTEDTSFLTNTGLGFSQSFVSGAGYVESVAVDTNNKIICVGDFTEFNGNTRNGIVRLNPDGTEDVDFYNNLGTAFNDRAISVRVDPFDNSIYVGGNFTECDGLQSDKFIKLNEDGSINETFRVNINDVIVSTSSGIEMFNLDITSDWIYFASNGTPRFGRVSKSGLIDDTFFTNSDPNSTAGAVTSIKVQPSGKVLVSGNFRSYKSTTRERLFRLNTDGTEDTSFYTNLSAGGGFDADSAEIRTRPLPDGRILCFYVVNQFNGSTLRTLCLSNDGTLNSAFMSNLNSWGGQLENFRSINIRKNI